MAKGNLDKTVTLSSIKDKGQNSMLKKSISTNNEKAAPALQWRTQLIKLKPKP